MKSFFLRLRLLPLIATLFFAVSGCDADKDSGPRGELVIALADPPCSTRGVVIFIDQDQYGPLRPGDEISIGLAQGVYVVEVNTLEGLAFAPVQVQVEANETTFVPFNCP